MLSASGHYATDRNKWLSGNAYNVEPCITFHWLLDKHGRPPSCSVKLPFLGMKNQPLLSYNEAHARGNRKYTLSPLIFNFWWEPLACAIRQNDNIHGFVTNSLELKTVLYAGDLLLFISESQSSIPISMDPSG